VINEHATVVSLLDAVRLLDQPLRCAFLDVACANDAELRGQVELLLTAVAVRDDCLEPLGPGRGADDGAAESMLSPGQVLKNRYEIEGQHGAGGQGVVYRAFDRVLSRRVVIKVMRAVPAYNAPLKARFEDEMRALSRIDHPSVLGILDVDALPDGAPFLILPFVDGVSVRQLVEQGSVDTSRTVGLIRAIGAALSAVHAAGVAHHDLKPENIIVQSLGGGTETIKLIDFGLAKVDRVDVSSDLTTVMIAGTVRYMAPEQFDGRNTKAADIYALGLVACELLCGHPDVRALPRRTPVKVRRLLERAVAYAPEARPSDAKAWADALASQLSRRWRLLAPIPAAITAVILGGIGLLSSTAVRSTASGLNGYHFTPVATDGEPETGAVWSRDGHSIAYTKMVAGTWQVCVRSTDSDTPVQLTRLAADASSLFWWPDGSRVGFLSDGMAWSVGRAGGLPEPVQHNGGIAADLSPDGGTLAMWRVDKESAATSGLWLASPPTAGARKYEAGFEKPGGYNPVHLRFSPDGAKILISFYAPDAQVWLVPSPRPGAAHEAPRHLFATTNFVDPRGCPGCPIAAAR
jgi:tRNA A-37 threonylcarbamoyl transferase component Bud32